MAIEFWFLVQVSGTRVYVSQGVRTDHTFDPDKWAGTVIVADADGSNQEIFASGFRNPFGLCFGPHGRLYCTDNDPDKNTEGEELNLVTQGNHYGFPMSHGGVKAPKGTVGPIALYHKGDLQGMTYANSQDMPDEYRDCLYVASTGSDRILRAKVSEDEEAEGGLSAEFFEFVDVPSPLDVATDNNGTLYSCSFADRKIYKIGFADQKN